jgi:superfamily I DNA/RNA helicase
MIELDPRQRDVASHYGSNALVIAGAGSGKTATIIERSTSLLVQGLPSQTLLMLTFTTKAAKEMSDRMVANFVELGDYQGDLPLITNFHQFGYRLIRKYPKLCGRQDENPSVLAEGESSGLWLKALDDSGFEPDDYRNQNKSIQSVPELCANAGIIDSDYDYLSQLGAILSSADIDAPIGKVAEALEVFQNEKASQNVLDFNDMIILPIKMLSTNEKVRKSISGYLREVVVDEAQDNNECQYRLLKLITDTGRVNTMMVGDDDQSIYEWRGAAPNIMQRFIDEFSAVRYELQNNYRSCSDIVNAASKLIQNNRNRLEKTPISTKPPAPVVKKSEHFFYTQESDSVFYSESEHAVSLGESLAEYIVSEQQNGRPLSDFCVLYRANRMGVFIEKSLVKRGIRTKVLTGTGLMDRTEAKMAMACLRLASNPFDATAFKRYASTFPGVGKKTIEDLIDASKSLGIPLIGGTFKNLTAKQQSIMNQIHSSIGELNKMGPEAILKWSEEHLYAWVSDTCVKKIAQEVKKGDVEDNEEVTEKRKINLIEQQFSHIQIISEQIIYAQEKTTFPDKWSVVSDLSLDAPNKRGGQEKDAVILSSIHSFKGRQAPEVHIAGFTDGLMPKRDKDGKVINAEEERRLAYVALTRAETRVWMHHVCKFDFLSGGASDRTESKIQSSYLNELRGKIKLGKATTLSFSA